MPMFRKVERSPLGLFEGCSVRLMWGNQFSHNLKSFCRRNILGQRVEFWTDGQFTWTASGRIKSPRCLRHDRAYDIAHVISDTERRWWPTPADDRPAHYYDPTGMTEFRIQQLRKAARVAATTAFVIPSDTEVLTESPPCEAFSKSSNHPQPSAYDEKRDLTDRITITAQRVLSLHFGVDEPRQAEAIGRAVALMILNDRRRDKHNFEIGNTISKSEKAERNARTSSQTDNPICAATGELFRDIPHWRLRNLMKTKRITREEFVAENMRRHERFFASK